MVNVKCVLYESLVRTLANRNTNISLLLHLDRSQDSI